MNSQKNTLKYSVLQNGHIFLFNFIASNIDVFNNFFTNNLSYDIVITFLIKTNSFIEIPRSILPL